MRTSLGQLPPTFRSTAAHSTGWWALALVTPVALIDLARTWPPHRKPQSWGLFIPFITHLLTGKPGPFQSFCALMHLSKCEEDAVFQGIKTDDVLYGVFKPGRRKRKAKCSFLPSFLPLLPPCFSFLYHSLIFYFSSLPHFFHSFSCYCFSFCFPDLPFFLFSFFFFHYNNCLKFKLVEIFQDMHHICLQIKTRGRSFYTCSCSHLHISG